MRLVNAQGEIEEVTEESDPERMKVLRSSYGLLGVLFEVTFKTEPAAVLDVDYAVISLDPVPPVERVLGDAQGVLAFIDPYARRVIAERRRVARGDARPSRFSRMKRRMRDKLWEQYSLFPMLMRNRGYAMTSFGTATVMRGVNLLGGYQAYRADSNIDFEENRRHYFDFTFWAIPRSGWNEFVPAFFDFCDSYRVRTGFRYSLTTETYFMAQDQNALLSPSPSGPVFTMDPVDHRSTDPLWIQFNREFNELAADHGGRPFLNQTKELSREVVHRTLGDDWQRFLAIREREDPGGRFLSDYFAELI
jgi:FAD/FMN-containing dehydrogenase